MLVDSLGRLSPSRRSDGTGVNKTQMNLGLRINLDLEDVKPHVSESPLSTCI